MTAVATRETIENEPRSFDPQVRRETQDSRLARLVVISATCWRAEHSSCCGPPGKSRRKLRRTLSGYCGTC